MENWEVAAIAGAVASNRNRKNVIDALTLKLKLEDDPKKQSIIKEEINRLETLLAKEKHNQKMTVIAVIVVSILMLLWLSTLP